MPSWISGVNTVVACFYNKDATGERKNTVGKVVNYITGNSEKDDEIIVWGNWNIIYVVSERMPASKYSYQLPVGQIDASIMDSFFEEIQEKTPKMIIVPEG